MNKVILRLELTTDMVSGILNIGKIFDPKAEEEYINDLLKVLTNEKNKEAVISTISKFETIYPANVLVDSLLKILISELGAMQGLTFDDLKPGMRLYRVGTTNDYILQQSK